MNRLSVALIAALSFSVGCKKQPAPTPAPVAPTAAPVPVEAPPAAPEEVVQMVANFQRVFFELDSATLDASSKGALDENVEIMTNNPRIKVELQGHADERGTTDYNLALGQRRADSVRSYMMNSGVSPSRLSVVSYGEEKPLRGGTSEMAYSRNRRAEFVITWGDDGSIRGTTE